MTTVATIVLGLIVIVAALFFLSCTICAFEVPASRAVSTVFALISLAVMSGGIALIAAMYKKPEEPEERL